MVSSQVSLILFATFYFLPTFLGCMGIRFPFYHFLIPWALQGSALYMHPHVFWHRSCCFSQSMTFVGPWQQTQYRVVFPFLLFAKGFWCKCQLDNYGSFFLFSHKPRACTFLCDSVKSTSQYIKGKESSRDFQIHESGLVVACLLTAPIGFPKHLLHLILSPQVPCASPDAMVWVSLCDLAKNSFTVEALTLRWTISRSPSPKGCVTILTGLGCYSAYPCHIRQTSLVDVYQLDHIPHIRICGIYTQF